MCFENYVIWIEFIFLQFNMGKLFPVSFEISFWGVTTMSYVVAAVGLLKKVLCANLGNAGNRVRSGLEFLNAGGLGGPSDPILIDIQILTSTQRSNSAHELLIPK